MPRQWTREQREAQRQRMISMHEARKRRENPTQASVEIVENPAVVPDQKIGRDPNVLIAQEFGRVEQTVSQFRQEDSDQPVRTTHKRPGTMVMYKPMENGNYAPRTVTVSALPLLVRQGWTEVCPNCNAAHIDKKGNHSSDPNLCGVAAPTAVRVCPVCGKRIYDNRRPPTAEELGVDDDPNVIRDERYAQASTPELRTKASLDLHLWVRHPRWAQTNNVPPLPTALGQLIPEEAKVG